MGSILSTAQPKEGQSSGNRDASPAWSKHKCVCHCNEDPKPVKKDPRVLEGEERFIPQERRPMRCALCPYVSTLPFYHCTECFVLWAEDPASFPTQAEIEEKERQEACEGGHEDDCFHGSHCHWCSLSLAAGQI